ncbi:helix-turn-helix transcriptional regulator [Salipiger mangrovisoli]|uniref:Helix-turn-helix transcriptional regulator n=1 Tax=Salipiger mangrovisoli TaxID=2865933 RepID=A0ABR9WWU8_9RHOB|nr:helix-turn-helix transcriptional regulator [Salipiger mangrovisoli]MBE9635745.1 helix-turn-helix transcriptional regulator [Salipiger mangrovisoli]
MTPQTADRPLILTLLIAVQSLCTAFFVIDVVFDATEAGWNPMTDPGAFLEGSMVLCLAAAVWVELRFLLKLLRHNAHLERQVSLATGAFHEIVEAQFSAWGLTGSERDVAMFTLKGMTIPEIAALRGSAEGTVKSHLNAIYRKAGVSGRGALLSLFIEELMTGSAADAPPAPAVAEDR